VRRCRVSERSRIAGRGKPGIVLPDRNAGATRGAASVADGIVLHPGLVPSLEARARSAAGTGDPETDEASAEAL
jgi:hypothetical protein